MLSWTKNAFTSQVCCRCKMVVIVQVLVLDGFEYIGARCKMCCDATWQNDSRIILLCDMFLYKYSRCTFQTYQSIKYYCILIFVYCILMCICSS
ncbi:unnamed protein product [Malus baccata var. baccata]